MEIHYLDCDGKKKLFSFFTHDYKEEYIDNNYYMLDGGFSYCRASGGIIKHDQISNLIEEIRNQFIWGRNYDENMNRLLKTEYIKLKDLTFDHIVNILKYFTENIDYKIDNSWKIIHCIFLEELLFRYKNKLI